MSEGFDVLEKDVQREGMLLLQSLGAFVLRTNQPRQSRVSPGLPDVIALLPRRKGVLFWEAKGPKGKQSDAQILVQARCAQADVPYVVGGLDELTFALQHLGLLR